MKGEFVKCKKTVQRKDRTEKFTKGCFYRILESPEFGGDWYILQGNDGRMFVTEEAFQEIFQRTGRR